MDVPPLTVLEVGESSKDGVLDGAGAGENGEVWEVGCSKVLHSAMEIYPILGISWWGNEKRLLDLLLVLEEGHRHEVVASMPKMEGRRELKNLESLLTLMLEVILLAREKARGFSQCDGVAQCSFLQV